MPKGMRSIKSTQDMKQFTKAMEIVASYKLRQHVQSTDMLKEVVANIAAVDGDFSCTMIEKRPVKRTAYLVITSDLGLAGGLDNNLLRKLMAAIKDKHTSKSEYGIFVIGSKGQDFLTKREYPIVRVVTDIPDFPKFIDVKPIASEVVTSFMDKMYDEVYLLHNKSINAIMQIPTLKLLLPLDTSQFNFKSEGEIASYEYEQAGKADLDVLLTKYTEALIFNALIENKASEFRSRMIAMGSVTKNATNRIDQLTSHNNRARQAAITQGSAEITSATRANWNNYKF